MGEVPGVNTISPVPDNYFPRRVEISSNMVLFGQIALTKWNIFGISLLPYCTVCKEPVNWLWPPEGDVLFRCPKCGREWVKDTEWLISDEKKTAIGRYP